MGSIRALGWFQDSEWVTGAVVWVGDSTNRLGTVTVRSSRRPTNPVDPRVYSNRKDKPTSNVALRIPRST
eukprot:scaffold776_cov347-Pavlova_lutheri.AAC.155